MIGETLKKIREDSGLNLSDIALKLRIRIEHLNAIEDNAFEKLPADVFTIGYLREYASFLNIASDPLVEAFKELKKKKAEPVEPADEIIVKTPVKPQPDNKTPISPGIKIFATIGAGAIALIIFFTIMDSVQNTDRETANDNIIIKLIKDKDMPAAPPDMPAQKIPEQSGLSSTEALKSVPSPVVNAVVKAPAETPKKLSEQIKANPPAARDDGVPIVKEKRHKLKIVATENTWLHIETGEGEGQEVLLAQGGSNEWSSRKGFNIKIGNAGGVKLILNGKDLGVPGEKGKTLQLRLPKE